ncbi:phage head-tail joining protein [Profundibacter sp.]
MAYSQAELDALKSAYAQGILRITYEGKTVEYGSADDLLGRIRVIEGEMATTSGQAKPVAGFASFRRSA